MSAAIADFDPAAIAGRLERIRERTLGLVAGLDRSVLATQHIPILSPIVWDLGHIAHFEELWLCQELLGRQPLAADFARLFDAVLNPRPTRKDLSLPVARELWDYMSRVRTATLDVLAEIAAEPPGELTDRGFIYEMVAEHEEQHQETILQLLQALDAPTYMPGQKRRLPAGRSLPDSMVLIPAGSFRMGARREVFAYDNERQRHERSLPAFWIDTAPVSCGKYLDFVEDEGYERPDLWSTAGWEWCQESGARAPGNWLVTAAGWQVRHMDRVEPLNLDLPVAHVCFHEAQAFARWAGKRLPTEAEWERVALWDTGSERSRRYPWGDDPPDPSRANVDQLAFQPAPIGAYPAGGTPEGVEQLIGDVWEWTSSDFSPYPEFAAFPYAEYSKIFFGSEYKVLRGGSWATRPAVARGTFRNWDYPIRRQIFAGFRCARDAD